ncbi:glucose-1-phosphate thymidylyltransferase [Candidatus Uhrbacteria bacterium]|nr:glucose-1-phosphate thymidylyltransferase [Candidatus Uhrbacteria bacterium]
MKAVIAAGGHGTRLRPITWTINKHLIPMRNEPMIFNAIKKIVAAGIQDIAINVNPGDQEIREACGDGSRFGARFVYIEQLGGAIGIGHIVHNAREFIGDDDVLFYLGDNIVLGSLDRFVARFQNDKLDCCLAFSRVADPKRFGVAAFDKKGNLTGFVEKPEIPPSQLAVTGIYLYKMGAHLEAFQHIKREDSNRNEFEITHINDWLLKNGYRVGYEEITGWWKDTGRPEDLLEGNQLLLNEMSIEEAVIDHTVTIDATSRVQGRVRIGAGSVVGPNVLVRGPVIIGENTHVAKAFIGPHTSIGSHVTINGAEIEHSIVMDDARIETRKRIMDSIIGRAASLVSDGLPVANAHSMVIGQNSQLVL